MTQQYLSGTYRHTDPCHALFTQQPPTRLIRRGMVGVHMRNTIEHLRQQQQLPTIEFMKLF